jgi:DNA ligase-1
MLGKTFKGMTDAMLEWQTTRFMELAKGAAQAATSDKGAAQAATSDKGAAQAATSDISPTHRRIVNLRPEQVVEIAFDGVQGSSRYPGGMALRFARVLRYRNDKGPADADTIDTVRALYEHRA